MKISRYLAIAAVSLVCGGIVASDQADARRGGGGGGGGGSRGFSGGGGSFARASVGRASFVVASPRVAGFVRRARPRAFYAAPVYFADSCASLAARARSTGSSYWWSRYRDCRGD